MGTGGPESALRLLAYVHPLWMAIALAITLLALRRGLALRSARRRGVRRPPAWRREHLRLAKLAMVMLIVGWAGGPASMLWLRDRPAFDTAHAAVATGGLLLLVATAVLGHRLERGRSQARDLHAALALASTLAAAAAMGTGFVLLP